MKAEKENESRKKRKVQSSEHPKSFDSLLFNGITS